MIKSFRPISEVYKLKFNSRINRVVFVALNPLKISKKRSFLFKILVELNFILSQFLSFLVVTTSTRRLSLIDFKYLTFNRFSKISRKPRISFYKFNKLILVITESYLLKMLLLQNSKILVYKKNRFILLHGNYFYKSQGKDIFAIPNYFLLVKSIKSLSNFFYSSGTSSTFFLINKLNITVLGWCAYYYDNFSGRETLIALIRFFRNWLKLINQTITFKLTLRLLNTQKAIFGFKISNATLFVNNIKPNLRRFYYKRLKLSLC